MREYPQTLRLNKLSAIKTREMHYFCLAQPALVARSTPTTTSLGHFLGPSTRCLWSLGTWLCPRPALGAQIQMALQRRPPKANWLLQHNNLKGLLKNLINISLLGTLGTCHLPSFTSRAPEPKGEGLCSYDQELALDIILPGYDDCSPTSSWYKLGRLT